MKFEVYFKSKGRIRDREDNLGAFMLFDEKNEDKNSVDEKALDSTHKTYNEVRYCFNILNQVMRK